MSKSFSIVAGGAIAVLVLLGVGDAVVAYRAGTQFQTRLESLNGQSLGNPALRLANVQVDRGWFQSRATAQLRFTTPGAGVISMPLTFQTTQGLTLRGSAMLVDMEMGLPDNPAVAALLGAVHDPKPVSARVAVNLAGQPTHIEVSIAPMNSSSTTKTAIPVNVAWGGGNEVMDVDGYFSPQGGSMRGTVSLLPWSVRVAQAAFSLYMGPVTGTFQESGRPGNLHGSFAMTIGKSGFAMAGGGRDVVIEHLSMQADAAARQPGDATPGNPSGLQGGESGFRNLNFIANLSKPSAGTIAMTGNAKFIVTPEALQAQSSGKLQEFQASLLKNAQVQLQVRVTRALLAKLPAPQLDQMESAGYLRVDGLDEVVDVAVKDGAISLNGHPVASRP